MDDSPRNDRRRTTTTDGGRSTTFDSGTGDVTVDRREGELAGNWRPTWTSTAIVLSVSLLAAVLAVRVGPTLSVAIAGIDAIVFATSLWLVSRDRFRVVTLGLAGVLTLVVGGGFAVAIGYTTLTLSASLFPVQNTALVSPRILTMLSSTVVVAGATAAMVGGVSSLGNVLRDETLQEYGTLTIKTFIVPSGFALSLLGSSMLSILGGGEGEGGIVATTKGLIGDFVGAFVAPVPVEIHLLTFALVVGGTVELLGRALSALPVSELVVADDEFDPGIAVDRAERVLHLVAVGSLFLVPFGIGLRLLPRAAIQGIVPVPIYRVFVAVTNAGVLRRLLVGMAFVSLAVLLIVAGLRRLAQTTTGDALESLVPYVGGSLIVAATAVVHRPLVTRSRTFVADHLPGVYGTAFQNLSGTVLEFFGSFPVALFLAATLIMLSAILVSALALVMRLGFLPSSTAPPALASAGLFAAAALGAASGVAAPLSVAGVVASIVAWDVGEYGTTVGREIGRQAHTRGSELVHATASVAVGALGGTGALAVYLIATSQRVGELTTVPFALVGVVVGLVLLVTALR